MTGIKQLEADLQQLKAKALPFATRNTVNRAAFDARTVGQRNIKRQMTLRNKWTLRSVQVDKAKTLQISRQESVVGSTVGYLETQEFGGVKRRKGKKGIAIATSYSSGEGESSKPRKRLPRGANAMRRIQLKRGRRKGANKRQQNVVAVREAAAKKTKFIYMETARTKGIFRVLGGKKKPRVKMVHSLKEQSVRIPKNPWLRPAVLKVSKRMPEIHARSLQFQIDRLRLFRS